MQLYEMCGKTFRLCYDTLNPLRYGFGDPQDELQRYPMDLIDHVHLKDAQFDFSGNARLGEGRGRLSETCTLLQKKHYDGWLIAETNYYMGKIGRDYDPCESVAADLHTMRQLFGEGRKA